MKGLCRWLLGLRGWDLSTKPLPLIDKAIVIFAPHTSNWDFVTMVMAKFAMGVQVRYLGKHSLFYWPTGWFFRSLGGMPVVRHEHNNVVGNIVDLIESNEKIWLALAPEGTRSFTPYWKSGFYHIAERSNLPILMFYLDVKSKTIGFSDLFHVTGNIEDDMLKIRDYYSDKEGYKPHQTSTIQTKKQYKLLEKTNAKHN
ncbi:MAG: 1-acyl-sn-glycerol-3-phosphate acyltransferase [Enterobacterales bacterium]|jgi:1-acyl-sn-glycerol-3-phosphate acyltransferase